MAFEQKPDLVRDMELLKSSVKQLNTAFTNFQEGLNTSLGAMEASLRLHVQSEITRIVPRDPPKPGTIV